MDSPALSYKKGQDKDLPPSPALPRPQSRKVLSRRKALQDFYKIQSQPTTPDISEPEHPRLPEVTAKEPTTTSDLDSFDFNDTAALDKYIKESSIQDILRLRNSITSKLNSHDLAKKSIIYDNYYELIKLSQVLGDISMKPKPDALGIQDNGLNEAEIDLVFDELLKFVEGPVAKFDGPFEKVVENLTEENDVSSVEVIADSRWDGVDTAKLVKEINSVLENPSSKEAREILAKMK